MFLITKQRGGYQAILIRARDKWDFYQVHAGRREVRIVLRLRGRRYLLYSTRSVAEKYRAIGRAQLTILCDEIIATTSACIVDQQEYIDFERIAMTAECQHHRRWRDMGLLAPASLEQYHGHPIDHKTELLVSYVRIDWQEIIIMDHEPPVDCVQEELPY